MNMRTRFDSIVADAIREIVELAQEFHVDLPCILPSLPGTSFELCIATVSLDYKPQTANEASLNMLLKELFRVWGFVVSHPDLDDGSLDVHRQSIQGVARNAIIQRYEETNTENSEFHALVQYPRHDSLQVAV